MLYGLFSHENALNVASTLRRISQTNPGESMTQEAHRYELWQDGLMVAATDGQHGFAIREILHYAMQYAKDGAIEVRHYSGDALKRRDAELADEFGEDDAP